MKIDQARIEGAKLNDEQMKELLLAFIDTNYCAALMRYIEQRTEVVTATLLTADPNEAPTQIARAQGIRTGLLDIIGLLAEVERTSMEVEDNQ